MPKEKDAGKAWIEVRGAPWGWTVYVFARSPGKRTARTVAHWIEANLRGLRKALDAAAKVRRECVP